MLNAETKVSTSKIPFTRKGLKSAPKITPKGVLLTIVLLVVLIIQVYPILWVILSSFKTIEEFQTKNPFSLPEALNFQNYINVLKNSHITIYLFNSFIVLIGVLFFLLVLSSMAAFAIEKLRFKYNKKVMAFFLFGIMVPIQISLIPLFQIYSKIGLLNTYISIILPQVGFGLPMAIYLFTAFYKNIPNEMLEAAVMDGCSIIRLFFSIIIPMSKNVIVTVATLFGVFTWNDFIFGFTFISNPDMYTVTLGLRDFVGNYGLTDWGQTFTAITLTVAPTYILYFFLSKHIISGMAAGAVKS